MSRPTSHQRIQNISKKLDKGKCMLCGQKTKAPESHHLIPFSEKGCPSDRNMMTLCRKCHKDYHTGKIKIDIERF
jgi:5-methylcytosine-specific restriction endonuclease McrA